MQLIWVYTNARSMTTSYGGGLYGHLGLLMPYDTGSSDQRHQPIPSLPEDMNSIAYAMLAFNAIVIIVCLLWLVASLPLLGTSQIQSTLLSKAGFSIEHQFNTRRHFVTLKETLWVMGIIGIVLFIDMCLFCQHSIPMFLIPPAAKRWNLYRMPHEGSTKYQRARNGKCHCNYAAATAFFPWREN
jgi:hypothetical protein